MQYTVELTKSVLGLLNAKLPTGPEAGLFAFEPLTEDSLASPVSSVCFEKDKTWHRNVVFRSLREPPQSSVPGTDLMNSLLATGSYNRVLAGLRAYGLGIYRVAWHVAECRACGARAVRPGAIVRVELEAPNGEWQGKIAFEREYAL